MAETDGSVTCMNTPPNYNGTSCHSCLGNSVRLNDHSHIL